MPRMALEAMIAAVNARNGIMVIFVFKFQKMHGNAGYVTNATCSCCCYLFSISFVSFNNIIITGSVSEKMKSGYIYKKL